MLVCATMRRLYASLALLFSQLPATLAQLMDDNTTLLGNGTDTGSGGNITSPGQNGQRCGKDCLIAMSVGIASVPVFVLLCCCFCWGTSKMVGYYYHSTRPQVVNFKCDAGHILRYWQQAPYDADEARCNTCDGRVNVEQGYLRCQRCNFNQCTACQYKKLRHQRDLDRKIRSQYSVYPIADSAFDLKKVPAVKLPAAAKVNVDNAIDSLEDGSFQLSPGAQELSPNSRRVRFEGARTSSPWKSGPDIVENVILDSTGGDSILSVLPLHTLSTVTVSEHRVKDDQDGNNGDVV